MLTAHEIALDSYRHGDLTDPARRIKPYSPSMPCGAPRCLPWFSWNLRMRVTILRSVRASLPYARGWVGQMWARTCVW